MAKPLPDDRPTPLWKRLAWMVAIWAAGVVSLGVIAMILRYWIGA